MGVKIGDLFLQIYPDVIMLAPIWEWSGDISGVF